MAVSNSRSRANKWESKRSGAKPESKLDLSLGKGNKKNKTKRQPKQKNNVISSGLGRIFLKVFGWTLGISLGLLAFLGIGKGLLYAYEYCTTSKYFALKTIEIEGGNRLKSREVLEIVGISPDMNSLALSMPEMEKALAKNPWVEELSIRRTLPDRIDIKIREREPRYWVKQGGKLYYADALGGIIAPVTPGPYASLPILEIEDGAEQLAEALPELSKSLASSELAIDTGALAWIRLRASGDLELKVDERLVLMIGISDWQDNLDRLNTVVRDLSRRGELKTVAKINAQGRNVWVSKSSRAARAGYNGGSNG